MQNKITQLKFIESKFDFIICLNANLPENSFFENFKNIKIISADGAAQKLYKKNIKSDIIIGDLDSFDIKSENFNNFFEKTLIIKNPDQSTNDFEKILNWCINENKLNLLITGIHGGDLEHTLNNWSIFMRYSKKMNLCIYDNNRYAIAINKSIEFSSYIGEIISIIPQPSAELSSENLKWELNNYLLDMGKSEGARNCSKADIVKIILHNGSFLLFFDSKVPKSPIFL